MSVSVRIIDYSANEKGGLLESPRSSGHRIRARSSAPRIFQKDSVGEVLALNQVDGLVLDGGKLGQRLIVQQALPELLGPELHRLGDHDDLRVHGDHALQAGGLIALDPGLRGDVQSPAAEMTPPSVESLPAVQILSPN